MICWNNTEKQKNFLLQEGEKRIRCFIRITISFVLSKRTKRINSNKIKLFERTFYDFETFFKEFPDFDMSYKVFEEIFREAWKIIVIIICILITPKKLKINFTFVMKTKTILLREFQKQVFSKAYFQTRRF